MIKSFTPAALALVLAASSALAQDDSAQLAGLIEKVSPSIVNVRVVLKVEVSMNGQVVQNAEERSQMAGVVVDAGGLIMISNSTISAARMNKSKMFAARGLSASIVPTNMKVILNGEEEEHAAFLAASDSDLDLAFIQLEKTDGLTLTPVSFADAPKPTIGQRLVQITRLSEGFDYAAHFSLGRVSGRIKKPRKAWVVTGALGGAGLPIYSNDGAVMGVLTSLESGVADGGSMMGGAGGGGQATGVPVLVGSKKVRGVLAQAKTRALEVAAERAKGGDEKKDEAPASQPAPAPGK
jgi:hypothetical protein